MYAGTIQYIKMNIRAGEASLHIFAQSYAKISNTIKSEADSREQASSVQRSALRAVLAREAAAYRRTAPSEGNMAVRCSPPLTVKCQPHHLFYSIVYKTIIEPYLPYNYRIQS